MSPCYSGGFVGRLHPAFSLKKYHGGNMCMYNLFVGIDVSKDSFSVAGLNEKAKLLFSLSPLMNAQGFYELIKALRSHQKDFSSVVVTLESTGPYHLNLFFFPRVTGYNHDSGQSAYYCKLYQTLPEEDQDRQKGCRYHCPVSLSQPGLHQPTSILPTNH
jgi:hypothetical protein